MTSIGDRVSQLSSALGVYGTNGQISTSINPATGLPVDNQTNLDNAHSARLLRDEMARLMMVAPTTSTGGLIGSTTTANLQNLSTGLSPFGIASTRYATSGTP
jgi:hypothetical protein